MESSDLESLYKILMRHSHNPFAAETIRINLQGITDSTQDEFWRILGEMTDPAFYRRLELALGWGEFLTETIRLWPEAALEILKSGQLPLIKSTTDDSTLLPHHLYRFRRLSMLAIFCQEFSDASEDYSITKRAAGKISATADALIQATIENLKSQDQWVEGLTLIALGKWGGEELNYSSDLDLIFIHPDAGKPSNYLNVLAWKAIQRFHEQISSGSPGSATYRLDYRLRPDGQAGPTAMSLRDALRYYEVRGEPWERLMLQKSRFVSGERELFDSWRKSLTAFVYPRSWLFDPLQALRTAASRMFSERRESDLKNGEGGIRQAETVITGLAFLYGGEKHSLRWMGTFRGIGAAEKEGLLTQQDVSSLRHALVFLRRSEHLLQLEHDLQTHRLPQGQSRQNLLASYMGFSTYSKYLESLEKHRSIVQRLFQETLGSPKTVQITTPSVSEQKPEMAALLARLAAGSDGWGDEKRRRAAELLGPKLQRESENAFDSIRALRRLNRIIEAYGAAAQLMREMSDNEALFDLIFQVLAQHEALTEMVSRRPELIDRFSQPMADKKSMDLDHEILQESVRFIKRSIQLSAYQHRLSELAKRILKRGYAKVARDFFFKADLKKQAVIGLGRIGAQEMIPGSDLDLIFFGSEREEKQTIHSPHPIPDEDRRSFPYTIDLCLRPEGRAGSPLIEPGFFKKYLSTRASSWERIAYQRWRFLFGDKALGSELTDMVRTWLGARHPDAKEISEVWSIRRKMESARGLKGIDLKHATGGTLDVDFWLGILRWRTAAEGPDIHLGGWRTGITWLKDVGALKSTDANEAMKQAEYLHTVLLHIRLITGLNTNRVPPGAEGEVLARSLGFPGFVDFSSHLKEVMNSNRTRLMGELQRG